MSGNYKINIVLKFKTVRVVIFVVNKLTYYHQSGKLTKYSCFVECALQNNLLRVARLDI